MRKIAWAAIAGLVLSAAANATPVYSPVGPQLNVSLSTVTSGGWTQCYSATMSVAIGGQAEKVLNACHGTNLMMAGRETGSSTLLVLAETTLSDAIVNTGNTSITHISNGSQWWYAPNWSWGFAALDETVQNNSCNVSSGSASMCLHTENGVGGYRINDIKGLNESTGYEKLFFVSGDVPEPATIVLLGAGLFGVSRLRRRK